MVTKNAFIPAMMKKTLFLCFLFMFLMQTSSFGQVQPLQEESKHNLQHPRQVSQTIFSNVRTNKQVSTDELKQLKVLLQSFVSVLEQKLLAADTETTTSFTPVNRIIDHVLQAPNAATVPGDDLHKEIAALITEIGNDPLLAMAYEESLRHSAKIPLATILPDRGHGATYRLNEALQFAITASQDCFIQIFFLSSPNNGEHKSFLKPLTFHPEPGKKSVSLSSGDMLILGEDGTFTVEPPYGRELIIVVASPVEIHTQSKTEKHLVAYPFDFATLFGKIYGTNVVDSLSLHSCFIESRPPSR